MGCNNDIAADKVKDNQSAAISAVISLYGDNSDLSYQFIRICQKCQYLCIIKALKPIFLEKPFMANCAFSSFILSFFF